MKTLKTTIILTFICVALIGCTLGTDFKRYEEDMKEIERIEKIKHRIDSMEFANQMWVLNQL